MNHTLLPKEVLLPDSARRDMQVTKGRSCIDYSLELFARRKLRGKSHAYVLCVQQDRTRACKQYGASSSRFISARR